VDRLVCSRCKLPIAAPVRIGAPSQTSRAASAFGSGGIGSAGSNSAV